MSHLASRALRRLFAISPGETTFARRGFRGGGPEVRARLERIGLAFLGGYHHALEEGRPGPLAARLGSAEPELRGFAFEGAAMGLALVDLLTLGRGRRLRAFLDGPGDDHAYLIHVGAGWLPARLGLGVGRIMAGLDPLLRWLVVDGYGFHEGYFRHQQSISRRSVPEHLAGDARRAFDQGLGRSLWFVEGAEVARIAATIARFEPARRPDLWSGVGLACAYAGGADRASLAALLEASGAHRGHLAQGAAFAAKARQRGGNPAPHTEDACRAFCSTTADEAAVVTDECLEGVSLDGGLPAYEAWRGRIRCRCEARFATPVGDHP